jgi:hypothetical protein
MACLLALAVLSLVLLGAVESALQIFSTLLLHILTALHP